MEQSLSYEANTIFTSYKIPHLFMEPTGLLLRSQQPDNETYCEPDESSPYPPILFPYDPVQY